MEFDVPVIGVGNLRVGGTGKTAMVDYLLSSHLKNVGVLSRGYGRVSKGFAEVLPDSSAEEVGDEPLMIKRKHPNTYVAVCEKRTEGILQMLFEEPDLECIILDDNFQHRYVKPSFQIVLSEFHRPFFEDKLLPEGRLRESRSGLVRTDALVVTKCPDSISVEEKQKWVNRSGLKLNQVFFSQLQYAPLRTVSDGRKLELDTAVVLAGIDNPAPMVNYLKSIGIDHCVLPLKDHQRYTGRLVKDLLRKTNELGYSRWVTTEKDWVKLEKYAQLLKEIRVDVLPVKIVIDREKDLQQMMQANG